MNEPVACLGIDVSKAKLDGVVELRGISSPLKGRHQVVPNTPAGVDTMLVWATKLAGCAPSALLVVMEVTGGYQLLAARTAYERGCPVAMANPRRSRQFARALGCLTKTDKLDAATLARFGLQMPMHPWEPAPPAVDELYALLSRRRKMDDEVRREEACLEPLERKGCPPAARSCIEASIRFHLEASHALSKAIDALFEQNDALRRDRELLMSIPGIGLDSACYLIWLLRSRRFRNAREVAALCGVVPIHQHSGTQAEGGGHISRASHGLLRAVLHMPAVNAKSNNPQMKAVYERLIAKGRHSNQALVAIKRRLIHIAFGVLKNQKPYCATWSTLTGTARAALPDTVPLKRTVSKIDRRRRKLHAALGLVVKSRPWSAQDVKTLHEHAGKCTLAQLVKLLDRSSPAIRMKLKAEGLPPPGEWSTHVSPSAESATQTRRAWTVDDVHLLKDRIRIDSLDQIALALDRSEQAVRSKLITLGIFLRTPHIKAIQSRAPVA